MRDTVIFKGGTSLSKIFHLIKRFSEDIDLILNWKENPIGNPLERRSNAQQAKFNEELDTWGQHYIADVLLPEIQKLCAGICVAELSEEKPDNIIITYPKSFSDEYLRPQILLEIGAKAAWVPHAAYKISPYASNAYPQLLLRRK